MTTIKDLKKFHQRTRILHYKIRQRGLVQISADVKHTGLSGWFPIMK